MGGKNNKVPLGRRQVLNLAARCGLKTSGSQEERLLEFASLAREAEPAPDEPEAIVGNASSQVHPSSALPSTPAAGIERAAAPATASGDELPTTAPSEWDGQRKMISRIIIGLRDGWADRNDADEALRELADATGPAPLADERAAFEAWARKTHRRPGTSFSTSHDGTYVDNRIAAKWAAWQARAAVSAATKPTACTLPPPGWHCTRAPGHEGPCAAVPTEVCADDYTPEQMVIYQHGVEDGKLIARGMERYKAGVAARDAATKPAAATAVPEGWKLVPVEPSIAMCIHGSQKLAGSDGRTMADVYRAMLHAAPATPAAPAASTIGAAQTAEQVRGDQA